MKNLTLNSYRIILAAFLLICAAGFAGAGSEHGFGRAAGNCGGVWRLPDTGQTVHYSTAPGDDSDYHPAAVQPSYTDNGNFTVTDNITGLVWKKCSEGQINNATCSGAAATYTWLGAIGQCEGLTFAGASDWRLPNIKELMSIVDYGTHDSSKIGTCFTNTYPYYYWSSTPVVPGTSSAWNVDFNYGYVYYYNRANHYYIRCVRAGP